MPSLLDYVLDAHGGLQQWNRLSDLITEIQMEGHLCPPPAASASIPKSRAFFSLREQRIVMATGDGGHRILIEPHLVSFLGDSGTEIKIVPVSDDAPWAGCVDGHLDFLRTAYILGFAVRHYATAPFLYAEPGFASQEVEPWQENGEIWRVLKVVFPANIESPAHDLLAYYGPEGRLRRTRYRLGGPGGADCVDYASSYQKINGIWLPSSHEVIPCDPAGRKLPSKHLANIRLLQPFFSESNA